MDLEKLQETADNLYTSMRNINVRSKPLKVNIHEQWCNAVDSLCKQIRALQEQEKQEVK